MSERATMRFGRSTVGNILLRQGYRSMTFARPFPTLLDKSAQCFIPMLDTPRRRAMPTINYHTQING